MLTGNPITAACEFRVPLAATAAGVTTLNSSVVPSDQGVAFLVYLGAVVSGTVSTIKLQEGDLSDASDMADVAGASYTILNSDSGQLIILQKIRPLKAFSRVVVTRTTQNVTLNGVIALMGRQRIEPVTQPAGTTVVTVN